jgi:hypothetical protein
VDALSRDMAPIFRSMLSCYAPHSEETAIDPDAPAEEAVSYWRGDDFVVAFAAEIASIVELLAAKDEERAGDLLQMHTPLPAGRSWRGWVSYIGDHALAHHARHLPQTDVDDGHALPRASRFLDKDTGNAAATDVLRVNESRLRAWSASHDGTTRLHLYADLGRTVGTYLEQGEVEAFRRSGKDPALEPTRHEATGCVVLMRRHHETGQPYVATAYPEVALPLAARERHPDLPLLFGGYFGQDYGSLDANRWSAERNVNVSTAPAVRARIVAQLADLLDRDDETLCSDVEALGSYVMPKALRRWVTGLHRRMTRLQW